MPQSAKTRFFIRNLTRGVLWLAILVAAYVLMNHYVDFESSELLMSLGNNPGLVYSIYFISEIVIGIIPPELFMMWSLELAQNRNYIVDLALLAIISYFAGIVTYLFGLYFHTTVIYRYIRRRYLGKFESYFHQFGGFLLVVAALTPLPFSGICMLTGAVNYSRKGFFLLTLTRFIRFAVYGYIMYRASLI